jgi:uncharacterized membrane protein YozB (DUF420 family)
MTAHDLPTVNAILNGTATVLLLTGYWLIRSGDREWHKRVMVSAFVCSILFLISYVVYHAQVGSVPFQKTGTIRTVYLSILLTHVVLAAAVPVLAIITLRRAFAGNFKHHRAIARWTLPIWLYVSITGVVIYWMLYRM